MKARNIEDSLKDLYRRFSKSKTKASALINDKEKAKEKIEEAFKKANANKADLQSVWSQFELLLSLVKDYFNGNYKDIPKKSIIAIIAGILYFLSPVDLIPDFILGFGLIDDVFIIGLVIKQVAKDLEKYKIWKVTEKSKPILNGS
jgi:uncharacterized membrane protein YkvA (DUF1232 family)